MLSEKFENLYRIQSKLIKNESTLSVYVKYKLLIGRTGQQD